MLQVCVIAIAGVFAGLVLKKDKPEYATLIVLLVSFVIARKTLFLLQNILEQMLQLSDLMKEYLVYIRIFLKMMGLTYLCEFASSLCKDSGYSALSNHIEIFGKVMVMLAGMPIMKEVLELVQAL